MAKVEATFPQDKTKYPLSIDTLNTGAFFEADNDTIVFVGRGARGNDNPLNIENGIGGYTPTGSKFRKLPKGTVLTITIT